MKKQGCQLIIQIICIINIDTTVYIVCTVNIVTTVYIVCTVNIDTTIYIVCIIYYLPYNKLNYKINLI